MAEDVSEQAGAEPRPAEERFVLLGLLGLFGVVSLFLLYVTLIGGGIDA